MGAFNDLSGQSFGRLMALTRAQNHGQHTMWRSLCDCGKIVNVRAQHLRNGNTKSCGCLDAEVLLARNHKHGFCGTPTYRSWAAMTRRCENPATQDYKNYGGRGITICKRWRKFENFLADMGERPPGTTLDRKNNDRGYSPQNCRWATPAEQANNRRGLRMMRYAGQEKTLTSWANQLGIYPARLHKYAQRMGDSLAISHLLSKV